MTDTVAFSITIHGPLYWPDRYHEIVEHARIVEALGFEYLSMPSHVVLGAEDNPGSAHRYRGWAALRAQVPQPPHTARDTPWLESLTTFGAIAGATSSLQLLTSILIAPLYRAPHLAKAVATLDLLSRGRVSVGVAASWNEGEYAALGVDFRRRGQILNDTIAACRALWASGGDAGPVTFESETVSFENIFCRPTPVREIPLLFGGPPNRRNEERIARWGQGWLPWHVTPRQMSEYVARLRSATEAAGRDPEQLLVVERMPPRNPRGEIVGPFLAADLRASLLGVPELVEAGANVIRIQAQNFVAQPSDVPPFLEELAALRSELGLNATRRQ